MREEIINFDFVFTRFVIVEKFQYNKSHLTPNFNRNGEIALSRLSGWNGRIFISPGVFTKEMDESKVLECV